MRSTFALALVMTFVLSGSATGATTPRPLPTAAPASPEGITVIPDPTSARRSPSGSFFELGRVERGAPLRERVLLRNVYGNAMTVRVYVSDAIPSQGGGFGFTARDDVDTQVGAWASLSRDEVTVPPRADVAVDLTLTVPPTAEGGEYVGGVIAEPADQAPGAGVRSVTRFAMAVYLEVPGGAPGSTPGRGRPDGTLELVDVQARPDGDRLCPVVRYRNDSQRVIDPSTELATSGLLGSGEKVQRDRIGAVLPDSEAEVALACIKRPLGPGRLDVTLTSPTGDSRRSIETTWLPWPFGLALLFLLLLVTALLFLLWRGRKRRRPEDDAADGAEGPPV